MHARSDRTYPWAESIVIFVAGFLAYELKRQFGLFAHEVFKIGGSNASEPFLGLGANEIFTLVAVLLGLAVYQHTTLPNAPFLERLLYRDRAASTPVSIWRPVLVAVLMTLVIASVLSVVGQYLGHSDKLFSTLHQPSIPRST